MKKLLNKGLVVVLALCMVFGMFTVGVSADEKHLEDYIDAEAFAPVVDDALDALAAADMEKLVADAVAIMSALEGLEEEEAEAIIAALLIEAEPMMDSFAAFVESELAYLEADEANVDALIADLEALAAVLGDAAADERLATAIDNLIAALQGNEDVQNAVAELEAALAEFEAAFDAWYAELEAEVAATVEAIVEQVEFAVFMVELYVYYVEYVVDYVYDNAVNGYYTNCDEDADYYVALGSATTAAADTYVDIVAKELGFKAANLGDEDLTFAGLPAYVEANAAEIAKATLITYNMDASLFVDAAIAGNVDWAAYLSEEDEALAGEIIAEAYAAVKAALLEEGVELDDAAVAEVAAYVENVVYALVAYSVETVNAIEAIEAINPEALIMAVGMYNIFDGLTVTVEDTTIDFTAVGDVIAKACDLYYFSYAMIDGGFTVVDICGTEIEGFEGDIAEALMGDGMAATKAGQEYIAAQILGTIVMDRQHDYVIANVDEDALHEEVCQICGFERIPTAIFDDVDTKFWAANYIRYAFEDEMMNGKGDNLFAPAEGTTRAQFITILYRMDNGAIDTPYEPFEALPFEDVLEDELNTWYIDAMEWAYDYGILEGYEDGTARPYDFVSRVELVTLVARYAEYLGYEVEAGMGLAGFEDATEVQSWGVDAMSWAVSVGLIEGYEDNTLRPEADTLRSEIATVAYRMDDIIFPDYEADYTLADILPWNFFAGLF